MNAMDATSGHVVEDQSEVIAFLSDAATYQGHPKVARFETHGAVVFLAGGDAFKMKRAVHFPFMDYSTLDRRRAACEAELRVNRPNAPGLYLGLVPVTRGADGLVLGGDGEPVEWTVHMRRFAQDDMLDAVAARGGLTPDLVHRLARAVLGAHRRAPVRPGGPAAESLLRYVAENEAAFREDPDLFPPAGAAALTARCRHALAELHGLLLARGEAGYVRECHGDLHMRNVVVLDGEPTLFDAVEFDPAIATGDVLYDLAFLLMDLWHHGHGQAASELLNRYLSEARDEDHLGALAALPLFISLRAAIRAKVIAAGLRHLAPQAASRAAEEAARYFALAGRVLEPREPRLVAVGGLSGTGKSVLSRTLAPSIGPPPGALHLRSDVERKALFGCGETEHLPPSAYDEETGRKVYTILCEKAGAALHAGWSVVVDAVFSGEEARRRLESVAAAQGARFDGLWLEADLPLLLERVRARHGDASDADEAVVRAQAAAAPHAREWTRIDAGGSAGETLAKARRALGA